MRSLAAWIIVLVTLAGCASKRVVDPLIERGSGLLVIETGRTR